MAELKIEAGKYYKTAGGLKAFCQGFLLHHPPKTGGVWRMRRNPYEGFEVNSQGESNGFASHNLVEEWKEPATIEAIVYLRVYNGNPSFTLDPGPPGASKGSATVKLVEGQFAD